MAVGYTARSPATEVKVPSETPPHCPDFDLAPLTSFDRSVFSEQRSAADGFVLLLALVYNDLKDTMWVLQMLDRCPQEPALTPTFGQWMGMRLNATRQVLRIIHMMLEATKRAHSEGTTDDPVFAYVVRAVSSDTRTSWDLLLGLAQDRNSHPVARFIMKVRHKLASHFDWKILADGYSSFFHRPVERTNYNEFALASIGSSPKETRFFFADAAAQRAVGDFAADEGLMNSLDEYVLATLKAVQNIVEGYMLVKQSPTHMTRALGGVEPRP